jgi:hypothetical protein
MVEAFAMLLEKSGFPIAELPVQITARRVDDTSTPAPVPGWRAHSQ